MKRVLVVGFILLATAWAGCLGDDGSGVVYQAPVLRSGYAYAYETTGVRDQAEYANGADETSHEELPNQIAFLEILNTRRTFGGEPIYLAASATQTVGAEGASGSYVDLVAFRQRDLASVDVDRTGGDGLQLAYGGFPAANYLEFPLQKGNSWSHRISPDPNEWNSDADKLPLSDIDWAMDAEVAGPRTLDLSVGPTQTLRVDISYTPIDLESWRRRAILEGEGEGYTVDSYDVSVSVWERVYYSDAYQVPVQVEFYSFSSYHATGQSPNGKDFEFGSTETTSLKQVLIGGRLGPKPERDDAYIVKVMNGEVPVQDVRGLAHRPAGYTLNVTADKLLVNAADSESVNVVVGLAGVDALPEGHEATWRLLDGDAAIVEEGQGLSFGVALDEPGEYAVEVETRDADGATTAIAGLTLAANYERVQIAECFAVALLDPVNPLNRPCDRLTVPVRPGIKSLVVEARVTAPVPLLSEGTLRLTDPDGFPYEAYSGSSDTLRIRLDDFTAVSVSHTDWELQYWPQTAVLENVEYYVLLDHTTPAIEGSEAQEGSAAVAGPFGPWAGMPALEPRSAPAFF